jgi:hypothetical protein
MTLPQIAQVRNLVYPLSGEISAFRKKNLQPSRLSHRQPAHRSDAAA